VNGGGKPFPLKRLLYSHMAAQCFVLFRSLEQTVNGRFVGYHHADTKS
jgi:hypothetical protein